MKTDTNYVAAVEKAIAEKYGKKTVQDFRHEWSADKEKEYLEQLQQRGKKVRSKKSPPQTTPAEQRQCPVCKTYSFSTKDDLYMNRFKCCFACYDDFVFHEEERWSAGWKPTAEHIDTAIRRRK